MNTYANTVKILYMEHAQIQQEQIKLDIELEIHQQKYIEHPPQSSWHQVQETLFQCCFPGGGILCTSCCMCLEGRGWRMVDSILDGQEIYDKKSEDC